MASIKKQQSAEIQQDIIDLENYTTPSERVARYLEQFKQESPFVRKKILQDIESVDALARLGASTVQDLVLSGVAEEREMEFDLDAPPKLACPHCGSVNTSPFPSKENLWRCYDCNGKFASNYNSIISQTHLPLMTWHKIVHCILSKESVAKSCKKCDLSAATFLKARLRVFYALHIFFERHPIRLYGKVQCDETFPRISFRGYNLKRTTLFPPTDEKYPKRYKFRKGKERGGASSDGNASRLCIFAAATERASFVCYCGIGKPTVSVLEHYVPTDIFLDKVPENDDFPYAPQKNFEPEDKPGDESIYLCDGSSVMARFGRECLPLKTHSRVYRKDGVQLKLPKSELSLHIQRVNNLHKRFHDFLDDINGSSRFVKGHILVFNFITNTGGLDNPAVVDELMHILVEPGLGKEQAFLEEMFATIPNYLLEWRSQDNVVSKLQQKNVIAYLLMDKIVHPEDHPADDEPICEDDIIELTGLKLEDIYAIYRDYTASGLRQKILETCYGSTDNQLDEKKRQRIQQAIDSIQPTDYILYDRYMEYRAQPAHLRKSLRHVCDEVNAQYGTDYTHGKASCLLSKIENLSLRPKRVPLNTSKRTIYSYPVYDLGFDLIRDYMQIIEDKEKSGETLYTKTEVMSLLTSKYPNYSRGRILAQFRLAVKYIQNVNPDWTFPVPPAKKKCLPTARELVNIAVECVFEDYTNFCSSKEYSEEAEERFLRTVLDEYNIRQFNINTLRARFVYLSRNKDEPMPLDCKGQDRIYGMSVPESATKTLAAYERIVQEYLDSGRKAPPFATVISEVQKEVPLAPSTLKKNLALAHAYRRLVHPDRTLKSRKSKEESAPKSRLMAGPRAYGHHVSDNAFKTMEVYERIVQEYQESGTDLPSYSLLLEEVQQELHIATNTINSHITEVRACRRASANDVSELDISLDKEVVRHIYDEYSEYRSTHQRNAKDELAFFENRIASYQLDVSAYSLKEYLIFLSKSGAFPKLSRYIPKPPIPSISAKAYESWEVYKRIVRERQESGQDAPTDTEAARIISQEIGLAENSVRVYLRQVRKKENGA